jgi:hypothetical protein
MQSTSTLERTETVTVIPADMYRLRVDYSYRAYGFVELLTPDGYNPKLKKGRARGFSSAVLHLAPANLSGFNVCQFASVGCKAACLNTAGHGGIVKKGETTNEVQLARIARTSLYFGNRFAFNELLVKAIATHIRRATRKGLTPVMRLNGTSDLPWETIRLNDGRTVLETFPDIQFYDYTKNPKRALANARGEHPANYHLTFSRSETNSADCAEVLRAGGNVAVVFSGHPPATFNGRPVISGDDDDLRFLDPAGVVVALKAKGRGKRDTSGFVVRVVA